MRGNGWFTCDGCGKQIQELGGAQPLPEGWFETQELCKERFCEGHPALYCSQQCRELTGGENWQLPQPKMIS